MGDASGKEIAKIDYSQIVQYNLATPVDVPSSTAPAIIVEGPSNNETVNESVNETAPANETVVEATNNTANGTTDSVVTPNANASEAIVSLQTSTSPITLLGTLKLSNPETLANLSLLALDSRGEKLYFTSSHLLYYVDLLNIDGTVIAVTETP